MRALPGRCLEADSWVAHRRAQFEAIDEIRLCSIDKIRRCSIVTDA